MVPSVLASQVDKEAKKAVDRIPLIKPHNTEATYNLNSVHLKQVLDGTSLIGNAYNGISVKESEKFFESQLSTFKDSDEKIKLLNNLLKTNRHFAFLFTINPQFRNKILDKMGNVNFSIEQSKMIKTTLKESLKEYQKYFDTEHKHTSKLYPAFSIASFFTLGIMYIPYVGFRNITGNNLLKDTYKHSNITLNATYPDAKPVNTTKSSSTNELLDILSNLP
jgi:hypothetical protein